MTVEKNDWETKQRELEASFLQSYVWADFQRSIGHNTHLIEGSGWSCLFIERNTAAGRYLFAPYGPTLVSIAAAKQAFQAARALGAKTGADWLRLEPRIFSNNHGLIKDVMKQAKGKPAPRKVEPNLTRIVDLTPGPEDILASISQTTRNIIRRNGREKTFSFRTSTNPNDMKLFTKMLGAVARRKGVGFYSDSYYHQQAEILMPAGMMLLELAYENKSPIGGAIIHDYNQLSSYTYAATAPEARDRNVSALLLWQAFMNARQRGVKKFDLYGIAPDDAGPSHPWSGFSSFKKKFGGDVIEYAGTWDIPLTSKYMLYRAAYSAKKLFIHR